MPLFNMQPKDKKSPRKAEVRPSNVVIRVLPLLLCFVLSVVLWCYIVGSGKPAEVPEADTGVGGEITESAPPADAVDNPAEREAETEPHPSDV